jgi:hypothetical protein
MAPSKLQRLAAELKQTQAALQDVLQRTAAKQISYRCSIANAPK